MKNIMQRIKDIKNMVSIKLSLLYIDFLSMIRFKRKKKTTTHFFEAKEVILTKLNIMYMMHKQSGGHPFGGLTRGNLFTFEDGIEAEDQYEKNMTFIYKSKKIFFNLEEAEDIRKAALERGEGFLALLLKKEYGDIVFQGIRSSKIKEKHLETIIPRCIENYERLNDGYIFCEHKLSDKNKDIYIKTLSTLI